MQNSMKKNKNSIKAMVLCCLIFIVNISIAQSVFNEKDFVKTQSGLQYRIVKQGKGAFPQKGDKVWVHYVGRLNNDSVFSSSLESGPLDITLGLGQIIKGWEEALRLIKPGGAMELIVPPDLAYGDIGGPNVPANATLFFELALMQVNKGIDVKPFDIEGKSVKQGKKKLQYIEVVKGEGPMAKSEDNAYVHYTGYLPDGKIFDSSYKKGEPVRISVGMNQVFEGWDMGLHFMQKGSKFRFIIPSKLAYGKKGFGTMVPPNTTITLDVEMVDLAPPPKVEMWNKSDKEIIETLSGLKYVIFEEGEGDLIEKDNVVFINYSGYFSDGKLFDSSVKRFEPIQVPVGAGAVIDGWEEGLLLMKKGAKFQLLIPSNLGYGETGAPPQIPKNADLIFDIEVLEVLK